MGNCPQANEICRVVNDRILIIYAMILIDPLVVPNIFLGDVSTIFPYLRKRYIRLAHRNVQKEDQPTASFEKLLHKMGHHQCPTLKISYKVDLVRQR
jgi:hypothetical protein